jgi:hypothetical protein
METLLLERFAYLPDGTFGKLTLPDGTLFYTAELPWLGNQRFVSCIPEGEYELKFRSSNTITRSSNGAFNFGWELQGVPDRDHILVHPGNWPRNVEGCIAVGSAFVPMKDSKSTSLYAVSSSQVAFSKFQNALKTDGKYQIQISAKSAK